jgi:hypothetical protein
MNFINIVACLRKDIRLLWRNLNSTPIAEQEVEIPEFTADYRIGELHSLCSIKSNQFYPYIGGFR